MPDTVAPQYLSTTPDTFSNQVIPLNSDFMFEMSEAVMAGSGNITISVGNTVVETIPITSSAVRFVGQYVIVTPPATFLEGQSYTVSVPYGAIVDLAGNAATSSTGTSRDVTLNFTAGAPDTQAPILTSTRAVVNGTIGFTFNEAVVRGTGNITVHNLDGSVALQYSVTDTKNVYVVANIVYLRNIAGLDATKQYYVTIDSTAFTDYSNNPFPGVSSLAVLPAPGDTQPPNLTNISPYNHFNNIPIDSPIVLTYSENVKAGSGDIVLASSDGKFVDKIDIGDTTQVTIVGNTVTIKPSAALSYLTDYAITLPAGIVQDLAGNPSSYAQTTNFETIQDPSTIVADTTPPTLVSSSPGTGATDVASRFALVLTFDEAVKAGTGNIVIHKADGSILESISVTNQNEVYWEGDAVRILPKHYLLSGAGYYVTIGSGVITDLSGNGYAGISDPAALSFTAQAVAPDTTPPTLITTGPVEGATGVRTTNPLNLVFNEDVESATGTISIYNAADNSLFESVAIDDLSHVWFNGSVVNIALSTPLARNTQYYVLVSPGAVTDAQGNPFAGISSTSDFTFTTAPTYNISSPYTVAAGNTVSVSAGNVIAVVGFNLIGYPAPPTPPSFTNYGTVNVTGTQVTGTVVGVGYEDGGLYQDSDFVNEAGATFTVSAPNLVAGSSGGGGTFGFYSEEWSGNFYNYGTFSVTSRAYGNGVVTPTTSFKFTNTGKFTVEGDFSAEGVGDQNGIQFNNSGDMEISSPYGQAVGVEMYNTVSFTNSGTISVSGGEGSYGVVFSHLDDTQAVFNNSGTITADVAFRDVDYYIPSSRGSDILNNSGTINGIVALGLGDNQVVNTGTINGDVYLDDGNDLFDGRNGTQTGIIYAGAGNDTLYGGSGNDTFHAGTGTDTFDGGGGINTVIFSGLQSDYTVTTNGNQTIVAGKNGTETLANIQNLVFNNGVSQGGGNGGGNNGNSGGSNSGFVINIVYDSSVASAPAGFKDVVNAVVQYYERMYSNPITLTIDVGYGEVDGLSLDTGALGESLVPFSQYSFSDISAALAASSSSQTDQSAVASLPATDPTSGGTYAVTQADAKALNLSSSYFSVDGYIGLDSSVAYDLNDLDGVTTGLYDLYSIIAHEIGHVMGRITGDGEDYGSGSTYFPLDLFHYASPGTRDFSGTQTGYFSVDGGKTVLNYFNTDPTGDFSDWAVSAGNDAFCAFATAGTAYKVTPADIKELDAIGWNLRKSVSEKSADFGGTGYSDILWQNDSGQAAIWTMNGLTQTGGSPVGGNPGPTWHVVGSGDFFGDGSADILWQNDDGAAVVWTMNGLSQTGSSYIGGNAGSTWHVKATGDFNGDGKADILWQNDSGQAAIWEMNGYTVLAGNLIGGNPGTAWHIVGAGDFNGDGKADIVWQSDSGQAVVWTMDGLNQTGSYYVGGNPGPTWHIKGVGDFYGTGQADILWQNDAGQAVIWTMNGVNQVGSDFVGGNPGPTWHIVGTGDYNGDGKADILWQNDNGQAAIWTMNGVTQLGGSLIGGNPGTTWHIPTGVG